MADKMAAAQAKLNQKMQGFCGRDVTYVGKRHGDQIEAPFTVRIATSVLTQTRQLELNASIGGLSIMPSEEADREYIVQTSDLRGAGLWPPQSGDLIKDTNDTDGLTATLEVSPVLNQEWRFLEGSYKNQVRVHCRWLKEA
jgi:hypothetical protein